MCARSVSFAGTRGVSFEPPVTCLPNGRLVAVISLARSAKALSLKHDNLCPAGAGDRKGRAGKATDARGGGGGGSGSRQYGGGGSRQNVRLWPQDLVASRSLFLSLGLDFPTGRDILSYELTLCSFITCYCWTRQTFGPKVVSVPARHRSIGHSQI